MSFPKVYIQIPHYNNSDYIAECIASCDRLDYPNLDIHFYDDASTDNIAEILKNISSKTVNFHRNNTRKGRVANYQYCFSLRSNAAWYINLDSDDYYTSSSWISEVMAIVKENPEDNICHIQSNFITDELISKIKPIKRYNNGFQLISGVEYLALCIQYYSFSHLGSIFQIEGVEKNGAYTDDCMHTDFFTAMRVAIQGNVLIGNQQVGIWRKHDGNQSDTRYSETEYQKNLMAYYHFFEGCESFISYDRLTKIVANFEKREEAHTISEGLKTHGIFAEFKKSIETNSFHISTLFQFIKFFIANRIDTNQVLWSSMVNISSGIITKGISLIIVFISLPVIVHKLGLTNYYWVGFYATIVSAIYILDFGFTNIVTKEIAQSPKNSLELKQKLSSLEGIYYLIGLGIMLSLFLFAPWISSHFFIDNQFSLDHRISILRCISIAVFCQWPHSFYSGALFGFGKQVLANNCQLVLTILKYLGTILILQFISADVFSFFYWQIAVSIMTILLLKFYIYREEKIWHPFEHFSRKYLSQIKQLAIGISMIGLFSFVYTDLVNILLARWLTFQQYSYYTILLTIVTAMITYCATIKNALFPAVSVQVAKDNISEEYHAYNSYLQIITWTLIPVSIVMACHSYDLSQFWLRNSAMALAISPSLPWIVLGSLANSLMIIPLVFLIAKHKTRYLVYQSGILALITVPALYFLIINYQLIGASIFWFIINILPCMAVHIYLYRLYPSSISLALRPFFYPILMGGFISGIYKLFF